MPVIKSIHRRAGASLGLGFNYLGLEGIAEYNPLTREYDTLSGITHPYYDLWASATFQFDKTFDGDFAEISISPVFQFTFSEKDDLSLLFDFSSRRSFGEKLNKESDMLYTPKTGREWFFKRFALSWTHRFM